MDEDVVPYMSPEELAKEVDKIIENPSAYSKMYIMDIILILSMNEIDFELSEKICRAFVGGVIESIQRVALYAISHMARVYKKLVSKDILQELEKVYKNKDHEYWGVAEDVYDDLEIFLKIPKPKITY